MTVEQQDSQVLIEEKPLLDIQVSSNEVRGDAAVNKYDVVYCNHRRFVAQPFTQNCVFGVETGIINAG